MHLDFCDPVALAGLAAPAADIKTEATRLVAPRARFLSAREQFPYRGEDAGVSRGIGARCATNRALVNVDTFVELLEPFDIVVGGGFQCGRTVQRGGGQRVERTVNKC